MYISPAGIEKEKVYYNLQMYYILIICIKGDEIDTLGKVQYLSGIIRGK